MARKPEKGAWYWSLTDDERAAFNARRRAAQAASPYRPGHRGIVRPVDAAPNLADARCVHEHTGARGAASGVSSSAAHVEKSEMDNRSEVAAGQAEVHKRVQIAVDRNVAARGELAASNEELQGIVTDLQSGDAGTLNFVLAYLNPTLPNPEPIAPDVAAPAPAEEPPVFTDISTPDITPDTTSGGESDIAASLPVEGFQDLVPVDEAAAPDTPVGGQDSGNGGTEAG